jgi:hypothetical protein
MLGTGISLASFRRFCAVAARRNSIAGTIRSSQSEPVKLENAFEMGE